MEFADIKNRNEKELHEMLAKAESELRVLRFSARSNQLKQVHLISALRKHIAQLHTVLAAART